MCIVCIYINFLPDTLAFLSADKLEKQQQPDSEHWGLLILDKNLKKNCITMYKCVFIEKIMYDYYIKINLIEYIIVHFLSFGSDV